MTTFLRRLWITFVALPSLAFANPPDNVKSEALQNAVILVIRHGEKPDKGIHLSPAGKARAKSYAEYFKNYKIDGQPLKIDALFAAADSNASHRPRLTLEPTAKALGLDIDTHYEDMHFKKLADDLRKKPHGKAMVICWHHGEIPDLLKALGADVRQVIPKGGWPDNVFNWVIQMQYGPEGRLLHIQRIDEPF